MQETPQYEILKARAHVLEQHASQAQEEDNGSEATRDGLTNSDESTFARLSRWAGTRTEGAEDEMDAEFDAMAAASATSESDELSIGHLTATSSSSGASTPDVEHHDAFFGRQGRGAEARRCRTSAAGPRRRQGLPEWTPVELVKRVESLASAPTGKRPVVVVVDEYALDVTEYAKQHPGGAAVLRQYAIGVKTKPVSKSDEMSLDGYVDASDAFNGGLNNHGWSARQKMTELRIARVVDTIER